MPLKRFISPQLRRDWYMLKMPDGVMKEFYRIPLPRPQADFRETEFLCVDLELTGLNPKKDEIISIGFVPIIQQKIDLSQAQYFLVRPEGQLPGQSVVIHGLTDDSLSQANLLEDVLPLVISALAGRVLLAHHVPIEIGFLNRACMRLYGYPLLVRAVDTLEIEKRTLLQRNQPIDGGVLRLGKVRESYNLPRYRAHNALIDAISCGELFLAQAAHKVGVKEKLALRELMVAAG